MKPSATTPIPPRAGRNALLVACAVASLALLVVLAVLANAALLAVTASAEPDPERVTLRSDRIEISNLAGAVRIVQGAGARAEVLVSRAGPDAARIRIEQDERPRGSELRIVYPGRRIVYPRQRGWGSFTTLEVNADGSLGHGRRDLFGGRRVTIAGAGPGLHAWADLEVRLPRGSRTTLRLGVGELTVLDVEGDLTFDVASAPVRAERTRGALLVDTGSGEVVLLGNRGEIALDTGSGRIELTDVRGGRLKADTGSGGVTGRGVEVRDLLVDTGSGAVGLDDLRCDSISVDTGSGGVRIGLLGAPRALLVDTGSGGVTILGPEDLDARVEIETGSGGVQTDYTLTMVRKDHDSLRGIIGAGHGRIHVDTGSGAVTLQRR